MRLTLSKKERLRSKKIIEFLVKEGNPLHQYPLHIKWKNLPLPERVKVQIAFTVPKRIFKKAVDRNRLKRRMKEAYRKNKMLLQPDSMAVLLVYSARKEERYDVIEKGMKAWMLKIAKSA